MATTNSASIGASDPVMSVNTSNLAQAEASQGSSKGQELYPGGSPKPVGTEVSHEQDASKGQNDDPQTGVGVEGELTVWEARYSNRNFVGRIAFRFLLTIAWFAMAYYTWGQEHSNMAMATWIILGVIVLLWVGLVFRMIQAHYSHYYRLTNRRLFVSTGVVHRRRDMMELLRVKDIFTRQQSLLERWLSLGTVVVVPTEKELPTFYLAGVSQPKEVMDLIWHHARAERDERSVKVDSI